MNVTAKITTQLVELEFGQVFAGYVLVLNKDGVDGDPISSSDDSVDLVLDAGTYTATVTTVDTEGNMIGSPTPASEPFTVPANAFAPVAVTVTLTATPPVIG